jgi:hypothetical protein
MASLLTSHSDPRRAILRKLAVCLALLGISLPRLAAAQHVSEAQLEHLRMSARQLEHVIAEHRDSPDADMASRLSGITLTERLNAARTARCEENLSGPREREAFLALASMSAFLGPPPDEIPSNIEPDFATQRSMIALTVEYATKTMHRLPNFFATRVTTSFQDNPWYESTKVDNLPWGYSASVPLHFVGSYNASVLYRKGKEVAQSATNQAGPHGLTTSGEFGPILGTVLLDAAHTNLTWSRWEQGKVGPLAVFRFNVPKERSHYEVSYCCVIRRGGDRTYFQQISGYEGEITVDPAEGTILRLSLKATSLKRTDPILNADIMVEYGPVELGGRTYICPLKGIALSLALEVPPDARRELQDDPTEGDRPPFQRSLNTIVFQDYHLLRASARLLPGYTKP